MGERGPLKHGAALHADPILDAEVVKAYDAWAEILDRAVREVVEADALVKVTGKGYEQKLAVLSVLRDATEQVLKLGKELGRTPAARARLGADPGDREAPDLPNDAPPAWVPVSA